METTNAVKLAADLVERLEQLYVEPTAASFREFFGKPYAGFCNGFGSVQCSLRGVRIVPSGEDGMDLTWSKFIKFCRENGLMEEATTPCNPKPARNAAAAATTAAPAAVSPAATSTTLESAEDAAASTPGSSTESTQASPSAPCSPVGSDTAAPLACAPSASATPAAGFDYGGLDQPTVDTLHLAEREICEARRDYVARLAQAVYIAHDALCGGVVQNLDNSKHGHRGDDAFVSWCASVGMKRSTAYNLLQVAGLLNGATPEEQAVLEAASPSLLYAAAKPSAPAQLVQGVKDGDITTHKQYQELLAQLKAKEAELARVQHEAELDRKEQEDANAAAMRYKAEAERRASDQQRLEGRVQSLTEALNTSRQEAQTSAARVQELEARPIEVKGADPDDIARWRSEGAKPVQDKLDQAQAEATALRERVRELEASQTGSESAEVAASRQIAGTVESILQAQFETLDALPYEVFEAAVEPFESLRDKLSEALEFGTWPSGKENP